MAEIAAREQQKRGLAKPFERVTPSWVMGDQPKIVAGGNLASHAHSPKAFEGSNLSLEKPVIGRMA